MVNPTPDSVPPPKRGCPVLDFDHHAVSYGERFAAWRALREGGNLAWSTRYGGFWVVSGHAEAATVLRNPALFSSRRTPDGQGGQGIPPFIWPRPNVPGEYDGEEHARLRRGFTSQLSPATIARRRDEIAAIVGEIFDALAGRAAIDAAREIAVLVPARVVLAIVGLDTADAEWMGLTAQAILGGQAADPERGAQLQRDLARIEQRVLEQVAQCRASPRDDILSAYARMRDDSGELLGEADLLSVLVNSFLFGGLVTAAEVLANAIIELDRDRGLRAALISHPEKLPGFVNEMVRYVTPAFSVARTCTADTTLGGQAIRAGERVLVMLAAANFDDTVFPSPTRIDPERKGSGHLAFGLGPHFCPGAPLARLEIELALGELLRRMPNYSLADPASLAGGVADLAQGWHQVMINTG